jgi:hypothetical protein
MTLGQKLHRRTRLEKSSTAKLAAGTLDKLNDEAVVDFDLVPGSLKHKTILKRLKRKNNGDVAPQNVSPVQDLGPMIVDFCCR